MEETGSSVYTLSLLFYRNPDINSRPGRWTVAQQRNYCEHWSTTYRCLLEHLCFDVVSVSCSPFSVEKLTTLILLNSRTGIGPEVFAFISDDGNYTGDAAPSGDDLLFNQQHGFYITAADYILRPEVLESNFYAWRVTGDEKYLHRAADAVESFKEYLKVSKGNKGYAGIMDVNNVNSGRVDDTESFWFAEVLKYLCVDQFHCECVRVLILN